MDGNAKLRFVSGFPIKDSTHICAIKTRNSTEISRDISADECHLVGRNVVPVIL